VLLNLEEKIPYLAGNEAGCGYWGETQRKTEVGAVIVLGGS
jgi:hypothetical protein